MFMLIFLLIFFFFLSLSLSPHRQSSDSEQFISIESIPAVHSASHWGHGSVFISIWFHWMLKLICAIFSSAPFTFSMLLLCEIPEMAKKTFHSIKYSIYMGLFKSLTIQWTTEKRKGKKKILTKSTTTFIKIRFWNSIRLFESIFDRRWVLKCKYVVEYNVLRWMKNRIELVSHSKTPLHLFRCVPKKMFCSVLFLRRSKCKSRKQIKKKQKSRTTTTITRKRISKEAGDGDRWQRLWKPFTRELESHCDTWMSIIFHCCSCLAVHPCWINMKSVMVIATATTAAIDDGWCGPWVTNDVSD